MTRAAPTTYRSKGACEQPVAENMRLGSARRNSYRTFSGDCSWNPKLRKRIGSENLAEGFNAVNEELNKQGPFGNVFTFIDASTIVSKTALWEERDRAIADGEERLNNAVVEKYAADKDARWGAKSKTKLWFGYRHPTVTPANVPDFKAVEDICPKQSMIFMDKLFDCRTADEILIAHHCHAATIRKNNNKTKNRDLDRWRLSVRMPFEGTFSKLGKRAPYRGKAKVTFQNLFQSICHNLQKALTVLPLEPAT